MHPLDLMKTRFQLQGNAIPGDPGHYKGVIIIIIIIIITVVVIIIVKTK